MAGGLVARHYLTLDFDPGLDPAPEKKRAVGEAIEKFATDHGKSLLADAFKVAGTGGVVPSHRVLHSPSCWHAVLRNHELSQPTHSKKICAVASGQPQEFFEALDRAISSKDGGVPNELAWIGADLPVHAADYWNPAESPDPIFSARERAHELMGIDRDAPAGKGVNVVIVDQGLNANYISKLDARKNNDLFGGGWHMQGTDQPGRYRVGHASMLARNVIKIAPQATIFDVPAIPANPEDTSKFISTVHAAFLQIDSDIRQLKESGDARWRRPWVFVNAWATFNRGLEHPKGNYSKSGQHQFNMLVSEMADRYDMIFAAGNCGQFCPSWRCGIKDVGPGHSIIGANSLRKVLTVGAVRADGMWLGYSSQGPGTLCQRKPDLCAASQFCEDDDATVINTGTSAACAVVAGIVAAIRSNDERVGKFEPSKLRKILKDTATPPRQTPRDGEWDNQFGHGIINLGQALQKARA